MKKWLPILVLAAAQFVMVLDTTVMNVAISDVVADLDTSVSQVQLAITLYTLVMAGLMLTGGKLGDILGRRRTFAIGMVVYAAGSITTALSPNVTVLIIGWSGLEGIGAAMVIPAIASLTARNYSGKDRAMAYGIIGGIAAAGVAAGPLIGGWVTETFTWRYVFAGETVVIACVLLALKIIKDAPKVEPRPALDVVGAVLSASGMGLIVFGLLRIPQWGLIEPKGAMTIAGTEITPLGFSAVPFLVVIGAVLMTAFLRWSERRVRVEREPLLRPDILRIGQLRGGLAMLGAQQLVMNGIFFVLPLYLQIVLGKDALETGLAILPISVTMFIAALGGPRLATRLSPRTIVQVGLAAMLLSAVGLISTIDYDLNETGFAISLATFGVGVGLLASQLGNVIMSSVEQTRASEAGGLQGTAQNLGASLGTALIGAILLSGLGTAAATAVVERSDVPPQVQQEVVAKTEQGLEFVPRADVEQTASDAGLPPDQAAAIAEVYGDAQLEALERALLGAAFFVLIGFWLTRRLPSEPLGSASSRGDPVPAAA